MKTGGIIVAAGMSSRMGKFKPMLSIGGSTIIRRIITTFKQTGLDYIVVVTGCRADELEEHISNMGVICLRNERFAETQMFDSAKIGLEYLKQKCELILFTPVDIPLFSPQSVYKLLFSSAEIACPSYKGIQGHPLLIRSSLIPTLLSYKGPGGLRGAIENSGCGIVSIPVNDEGTLIDADTPEDYKKLLSMEDNSVLLHSPELTEEMCLNLLHKFGVNEKIQRHCQKVTSVAVNLSEALNRNGYSLDIPLICSAALLHDIARTEKNHALVGAQWLSSMGYEKIAEIVADHMELKEYDTCHITEKTIVYLADKLVKEDVTVSLEERFGCRMKQAQKSNDILNIIQARYQSAVKVKNLAYQEIGNIQK